MENDGGRRDRCSDYRRAGSVRGAIYVPISVGDDSAAVDPKYPCCRGRGAIVALDAATGKEIWKTYTVPDARPRGKNSVGTQLFGPSGASIWASPTIDAKRRILYAGTGDNHSAPATGTSDAVLAFSLKSGKILWSRQLLTGDMGNGACLSSDKTNCPEPHGPDFDLGSSANLITLENGKRLLTIGQKSGIVWALDPDDRGRIVWRTRVGDGGPLGLLLRNAQTVGVSGPYQELRNRAHVLGACLKVIGEAFMQTEMKEFTDLVVASTPFSPEFIADVSQSPTIFATLFNHYLESAGSYEFKTSNAFAHAVPAMDKPLAFAVTDEQAFRLLAAIVRAAENNGRVPRALANRGFNDLAELKAKAKGFAERSTGGAATILQVQYIQVEVPNFFAKYLA